MSPSEKGHGERDSEDGCLGRTGLTSGQVPGPSPSLRSAHRWVGYRRARASNHGSFNKASKKSTIGEQMADFEESATAILAELIALQCGRGMEI